MSRIGKSPIPVPERRRRHDRRPPRHGEGPEGHARARHPRRDHRPPGRRHAPRRASRRRAPEPGAARPHPVAGQQHGRRRHRRLHARSSRSSASATAPPPQGRPAIELALGFSHPVKVEAPDGITFEVPGTDPHHRAGHRQGGGRPGRRQHPQDPQARALQGQGRPLPGEHVATQGREDRASKDTS